MLHMLKFPFWNRSGRDGERLNQLRDWLERSEKERREAEMAVTARLDELSGTLGELRQAANKHDLSIADMLDSWDEWRQSQEETDRSLLEAANENARREAAESQRRETALVSLAAACFDQLHMLRRSAKEAGDQTWLRQLELAEEKLSPERMLAGLQIIDETGCEVNYRLYEIAAAVDTENPDLAMRIAEVYAPGYAYRGRVLRKAEASAYRAAQDGRFPASDTGEADGAALHDLRQKAVKEEPA